MSGCRTWTLVLVGVLTAIAGASASAQARPSPDGPWVVRDEGQGRAVVAGYRAHRGSQDLRALVGAWGPPARLLRLGADGRACHAVWTRPRARVVLANFGFLPDGASACSPRYGRIQAISTVGARWRTDRGLAVGATEAEVLAAYPDASDRRWLGIGRVWLLRPYETVCIGECDTDTIAVSAILAQVRRGAVTGFHAPVGAAGE